MKKRIAILQIIILLITLTSCSTKDYFSANIPIKGLYWGMSAEEAEQVLEQEKIPYTTAISGDVDDPTSWNVFIVETGAKVYGIETEKIHLVFSGPDNLREIFVFYPHEDIDTVLKTLISEVGEFEKMKYISTPDSPVWQCESEVTLKTLEKQELLEEVERYYLEVNSEIEKSEEELEEMLCRPLTIMRVQEIADYNWILFSIDGITASSLKRIEKMGAEEYYKSEQEFQKRIEEYDEKKKNE